MHSNDRGKFRVPGGLAYPRRPAGWSGLHWTALATAFLLAAGCGGGGGGGDNDGGGDDSGGSGQPTTYSAELVALRLDNVERPGQGVTSDGLPVEGATITRNP